MKVTLADMKRKVYALIEELDTDETLLTGDVDLQAKFHTVCNQILYELARLKKIPRYVELEVRQGDTVSLKDISEVCGREVFQLGTIGGVDCAIRGNGTVLKVAESGTLEIDCFVYPERITETTEDSYEFELSADALEVMPYGIAADILKADVSTDYGAIYSTRYETMLQRLDSRYVMPGIRIEGGVDI